MQKEFASELSLGDCIHFLCKISSEASLRCLSKKTSYLLLSHVWFPTVQEVLHADWHDVWHSPHPPFFSVFCNGFVFNVLMCFIFVFSFTINIVGEAHCLPNSVSYCIIELSKIKAFSEKNCILLQKYSAGTTIF